MPPKTLAKTTCMVCKHSAKNIPSNDKGSVMCDFCERWFHPDCVGMSPEKFKLLLEWCSDGSPSPWKCDVCKVSTEKLDKTIKALTLRQDKLEARQDEVETRVDASDDKVENCKLRLDKVEDLVKDAGNNSGEDVWKELAERERKESNIIVHKCKELEHGSKDQKEHRDLQGIQKLFEILGVTLTVENDVKFVRRLNNGEGDTIQGPRPLAVYMRKKADRDLVLANSYKLDSCQNEDWRAVNVVADLTYQQRKQETNMKADAQSKNLNRSNSDIRDRFAWKVVGKRGAMRLQQVTLWERESVDRLGNVVEDRQDQNQERRKRGRRTSGESSPTQPREKRGKVQAADFGVVEGRSVARE